MIQVVEYRRSLENQREMGMPMTSERSHSIETAKAPTPVGPYSQAVRSGSFLFLSGQIGLDPETGKLIKGGVEVQSLQALQNLESVIREAGGTIDDIVKTTIFLVDLGEFSKVNQVYADFFGKLRPARSTVEVSKLPLDAEMEIEAIAIIGSGSR